MLAAVGGVLLAGCTLSDDVTGVRGAPAPPLAFEAFYQAGAVHLSWDLSPQWDGEFFRVYAKRVTGADYLSIAEVTNCAGARCSFTDVNVMPGVRYLYYVAAVGPRTGLETPSASAVEVQVPHPVPPPVPAGVRVVALDGASYITWDANARAADDFSHYRVWQVDQGHSYLLGETDSEGFLDLLAQNGVTYRYVVTSMDDLGHESAASPSAVGTPRPDFHNEWLYDYFDVPASSGFRFRASETENPVVHGASSDRHFRLEVDAAGWWLVPGPGTSFYPVGFATSALKCGVAADQGCEALDEAPTSGYVAQDLGVAPQTTYAMRVRGDDGQTRYAAIRIQLLGHDGSDRALMIFDWAYQLQPGNPALAPTAP